MKKQLLEDFKEEIRQIYAYLNHTQNIGELTTYQNIESSNRTVTTLFGKIRKYYQNFRTSQSTFEYKAAIVSLYGLLEKYIELWMTEYLNALARSFSYEQLSQRLQEEHFRLSSLLITKLIEGRQDKFQHLKKEDILQNLANCLEKNEARKYTINTEAFTISTGNLKHHKIVELFKSVDVNLHKYLVENQKLNKIIGLSEGRIKQAEKAVLYAKINQLVTLRNEIAHGSVISEILGQSEIKPIIIFLEHYGQAIFESLVQSYIQQEAEHHFFSLDNESIKGILKSKTVLAFEIVNYDIAKGDTVIVKTQKGHFFKQKIQSLQKNSQSFPKLSIKQKTAIAIQLEGNVKLEKSFIFYFRKKSTL